MPTVLAIAGFDPSSGAGVTADLKVFAAHGLFGTSCITALTVQATEGVWSSTAVSPEIVGATLRCLQKDLPGAGIKIGMLATAATVKVVVEFLEGLRLDGERVPVVLRSGDAIEFGQGTAGCGRSDGAAEEATAAGGLGDAESG